ncbi:MAG: hypothetical protein E7441_02890 [Ruminococcaceae bacterium]|nr:hypothetical protein [Oscillospiraceae bacterium]
MKRFLATILTISMCLSVMAFLPAVSAANENETVYDFTVPSDKVALKRTIPLNPTVTSANGCWYSTNTRNWKCFDASDNIKRFFAEEATEVAFDNDIKCSTSQNYYNSSETTLGYTKTRLLQGQDAGIIFQSYMSLKIDATTTQIGHLDNAWIAIKLDVPETSGRYKLTFGLTSTAIAPSCDIFWAPYEEEEDSGSYYVKDINRIAQNTSMKYADSQTIVIENVEIENEADYYILGIRLNGKSGYNKIQIANITLTKDETAAPTTINYGVFDNVEDSDAVTVTGGENNKLFGSVTAGTGISATAGEKEGYTFRYWVLGSAATGRYYSSEKTVTINPYANIALTAIYTEATEDTKYLDFFNWNGEFVDSKEVTDGKVTALPTQPTLTGYSFLNWILEDNKTTFTDATVEIPESISKAMAQYTAVDDYDQAVQNNGSETGWTRNGKLVTYSENYEFFTWLKAPDDIDEYNGEDIADKIPLAVLESDGGENFMLEYDKGEYTIKEAGILFGKTEKVNVESAYSKATAKYLEEDGHGQLTAAPEGDQDMELYARGYVMYNDKVIYTDAIEINYGN